MQRNATKCNMHENMGEVLLHCQRIPFHLSYTYFWFSMMRQVSVSSAGVELLHQMSTRIMRPRCCLVRVYLVIYQGISQKERACFMAGSEVALLRGQIVAEYLAAQWGLTGLAYGTAQHTFITTRMENMERNREALAGIVGDEQTQLLFTETLASLPEEPERSAVLHVLRHFLGNAEETEHLIASIQGMWETIDLLVQRFGNDDAWKMLHAPGGTFSDTTIS